MIVRERPDSYVLVEQHEHARVSGEFARHWAAELRPYDDTVYAVTNHDVGWRSLDAEVRFDPGSGRPYAFTDYPLEPKLRAYVDGLDLVEAHSPYAACLCSMHYASIVRNERAPVAEEFVASELARQERAREGMSLEELGNLPYNFRLLQLCDSLSLFVCLNEPGRNEHPYYRDGLRFMGETLWPVWEGSHTLTFKPNPFSEPFDIAVPFREIAKNGDPVGAGSLKLRMAC